MVKNGSARAGKRRRIHPVAGVRDGDPDIATRQQARLRLRVPGRYVLPRRSNGDGAAGRHSRALTARMAVDGFKLSPTDTRRTR